MRALALIGMAFALCVLLPLGCVGCWFIGGCSGLVDREFSPGALLKKYEHFKDIAARLDAKHASIRVAAARLRNLEAAYAGKQRSEWTRTDAEQHGVWSQEVAGMKSSYNALAAEYNALMAKENYAFCNAGDLPKGADRVLPREYRNYETE